MLFRIGKVAYFYPKIHLAVIELDSDLSVGENIRFILSDDQFFDQSVSQILFDNELVSSGSKGQTIGIKVESDLKVGSQVYKQI